MSVVNPAANIVTTNQVKGKFHQRKLNVITYQSPEPRENVSDQAAIVFSFASDWLRWWHEISGPITERGKRKLT